MEEARPSTSGVSDPREAAWSVARATKRKASTETETPSKRMSGDNRRNGKSRFSFLIGYKSIADFDDKYQMLYLLGNGGFGTVYAGQRKSDFKAVAIKCMPRPMVTIGTFVFDGQKHEIPLEVLLMTAAAGSAGLVGQSAVVQFLDWYDLGKEIIMVMERPVPCVNLRDHLKENSGPLDEYEAKIIMKQLVEAAIDIHANQMFHRDLKPENVLIQTTSDGPRVRIIDFGCACYAKDTPYYSQVGTPIYSPPEAFLDRSYRAIPTTVWQLGVILYELVDGSKPFSTCDFICSGMMISSELSHECQDLLSMCLAQYSDERATLEQIQEHPWLSCSCSDSEFLDNDPFRGHNYSTSDMY